MKKKNLIIDNISSGIAAEYQSFYRNSIQECCQFSKAIKKDVISKFGGIPDLPASINWPNDSNSKSYTFLAQIALSELPKEISLKFTPQVGILYFFIDFNDWETGSVKFSSTEVTSEVGQYNFEIKQEKRPWYSLKRRQRQNNYILKESLICSTLQFSIPAYDSIQTQVYRLENNLDNKPALNDGDYVELLYDEKHQFLGYYLGLQTSTYELDNDGNTRKIGIGEYVEACDWILLFKLESDASMDLSFYDAGKILFFIKSKDLDEMNFDNIKVFIDTT